MKIFPDAIKDQVSQLSLSEYWHIIRKRKRLAITFFMIAVLSTAIYSFLHPKIYKADTTILIERSTQNILSFESIFPVQTSGIDYYPTQHKILKSRTVAKQTMDHLNLWPQYAWASDPVEAFLRDIHVDPVRQSRLVTVSAFSRAPVLAADIANAIVKFYIEQNLDRKTSMSQQATDWIRAKLEDVRKQLAQSELQFEIVKLTSELSELNEQYLPKHPKVIRAESRLKVLEGQLDEPIAGLSPGSLPVLLAQLEREVESNRKIYDQMLSRLKETMVAEGMEDTNVIVVDQAEVPTEPVAPRILLNIFLSALMGLFGGSALCLVFESLDHTVKSPDDVEKAAQLPVLGALSKWQVRKEKLIVESDRSSAISEAFRAIRTSLLFSSPDQPIRTLLITSPYSEEGKTIVSTNLAASIAQNGARVLLVDADLRKPALHKLFQSPQTVGLTHALAHVSDVSQLIQETSVENLSVLHSGPIPPTPSELLGSQKMRELVERLRDSFDYVIFDSPPFLAVTDPVVLSTLMDGVLIVARYNKTPKNILARSKQKFSEVHARLLGVVINAVDLKQERGIYPTYSYSYYGRPEPSREQVVVKTLDIRPAPVLPRTFQDPSSRARGIPSSEV